jgi:branched-chain amino acid transport system permease protein
LGDVDATLLLQQLFNALTLGAIYALIAIGYTMVFGIIQLVNFAHGELFMMGSFVGLVFLSSIGVTGAVRDPVLLVAILVVTFAFTMTVMGGVAMLIERVAYRPLRRAPRLAPLITAIGISFILQNAALIVFGAAPRNFPQLVDVSARIEVLGASIAVLNIFLVVAALGLMVAAHLFITRTRLGRAMRCTALDWDAARLMGVNLNVTIAATFFIGGALAGAGGIVHGLYFGSTHFLVGFAGGLKAFTAAIMGGVGNTTGATIGGFIVAFIEVAAAQAGLARWSEAVVFALLIFFLVFRPTGLLGTQVVAQRR